MSTKSSLYYNPFRGLHVYTDFMEEDYVFIEDLRSRSCISIHKSDWNRIRRATGLYEKRLRFRQASAVRIGKLADWVIHLLVPPEPFSTRITCVCGHDVFAHMVWEKGQGEVFEGCHSEIYSAGDFSSCPCQKYQEKPLPPESERKLLEKINEVRSELSLLEALAKLKDKAVHVR